MKIFTKMELALVALPVTALIWLAAGRVGLDLRWEFTFIIWNVVLGVASFPLMLSLFVRATRPYPSMWEVMGLFAWRSLTWFERRLATAPVLMVVIIVTMSLRPRYFGRQLDDTSPFDTWKDLAEQTNYGWPADFIRHFHPRPPGTWDPVMIPEGGMWDIEYIGLCFNLLFFWPVLLFYALIPILCAVAWREWQKFKG